MRIAFVDNLPATPTDLCSNCDTQRVSPRKVPNRLVCNEIFIAREHSSESTRPSCTQACGSSANSSIRLLVAQATYFKATADYSLPPPPLSRADIHPYSVPGYLS